MRVTEIDWVGNKNLPTEVDVPDDYNASEIYDLLVEKYHCDISCYCMHTERSINYVFPCPSPYGSNVEGFWVETNFRKAIMEKCDGNTLWKDNRVAP